ncbi:MAG: exodeoxyribonuclease III [Planctomycetota bacterium]|nr:exodeoxyribonuclease III [Planctomycetota bacterium]
MRIVTWNVNSVRARLPRLLPWIEENTPDVLCLQETKVVDDLFPCEPLEDLGYNVAVHGQKTYNGVAILSRHGIEAVVKGFPDDGEDAQARVIGCAVEDVLVLNLYVPNGSSVGSDKYDYKLDWLRRLRAFLDATYDPSEKIVVCGDFNITFDDRDVHDPEKWHEKILCSTPERDALRNVMDFGLSDALRKHHDEAGIYTWWDMRGGSFPRDFGLRIDHFLMSGAALDACTAVEVDREARKGKGPSDHAPVIATLGD